MSLINVNNLTFGYEGSINNVFENVSFNIDTDWKLGLIGRNGKGKTTFLKLLLGKYEYKGTISKNVEFDYFPFAIENKEKMAPTNHLDTETKENLVEYLNKKKGFILVSHDRNFLDKVVDHIISINNTNIEIQKGNFTSWQENKEAQDNFEKTQNEKLIKDINRLETASKNTAKWSDKIEKTKYNNKSSEFVDRGYIGHQSAKMMKKSKVIEKRIEKSLETRKSPIIVADNLQIKYDDKAVFNKIFFKIENEDRIAITGKNGAGKSSLLKLIMGDEISYTGNLKKVNDIKISYVSQSTEDLKGTLKEFAKNNKVDESIFKAMLSKMGFTNLEFETDISKMSEGQKKKVLIAKSISEPANIYIWDEPLNYIDILTRIQIEEAIVKYKPTIIFVEHDETFIKNVATKVINLEKAR